MENIIKEQTVDMSFSHDEETSNPEKDDKTNSFGRFNSADELVKAYTNLEREFTKRSQRLKTLEKEYEEEKTQPKVLEYTRENWQDRVGKFIEDYPEAEPFKAQISSEILNGNLAENPNCLELALSKVLLKNYKSPKMLLDSDEFIENYVLNNKKVKDKIIKNYLENIESVRTVRTIGAGGQPITSPSNRPKTISEAGRLVMEMAGRGK